MSRTVTIHDGKGREVVFPSIARASRELGVCESMLYKRIKDGLWLHRKNGDPVKVRYE